MVWQDYFFYLCEVVGHFGSFRAQHLIHEVRNSLLQDGMSLNDHYLVGSLII